MKSYKLMRGINIVLVSIIVIATMYIIVDYLHDRGEDTKISSNSSEHKIVDIYGNDISLTNTTNNGVIISFWASWCTACINELPLLNEFYKIEKFNLVTINIDDSIENIEKYMNRYDLVFPVIKDKDRFFKTVYSVNALPLTIVMNNNGEVVERIQGELTNIDQIKNLNQLLKEN